MKHVGIAVAEMLSYFSVQGLVVTSSAEHALRHRILYFVDSGAIGLGWGDAAHAQKLKRCRCSRQRSIRNTYALMIKII